MDRWVTSPTWGPPLPCKQALRLAKQQTLHVHHAFLYISLRSLHEYDVNLPNFTFNGGREHKITVSVYSRLSLNGHLYKTDTSVKRTLRVGPCLSLLLLFDSL